MGEERHCKAVVQVGLQYGLFTRSLKDSLLGDIPYQRWPGPVREHHSEAVKVEVAADSSTDEESKQTFLVEVAEDSTSSEEELFVTEDCTEVTMKEEDLDEKCEVVNISSEQLLNQQLFNQPTQVVSCSKFCNQRCNDKALSISDEEVSKLKILLKGKSSVLTKNNLRMYLKATALSRSGKHLLFFCNQMFCVRAFSVLAGVSAYIIMVVIKDLERGRQVNYEKNSTSRFNIKKVNAIGYILEYCDTAAQFAPDEEMLILPKIITKSGLYNRYLRECGEPHVSLSTFYNLFDEVFGPRRKETKYPHIRFSKYSTHSKCNTCTELLKDREVIKTVQDKKELELKTEAHIKKYRGAREVITRKLQQAISFPQDVIAISIDDMDNSKSLIPKIIEPGKALCQMLKLDSKITGVIVTSGKYECNRKIKFYVNHAQFPQDPNKVITILFKTIKDFHSDHGSLPPKLFINADNCARENKNQPVLGFLYALVDCDVFKEVEMQFLMVGHTGNNVDQLFSMLSSQFKNKEIRTVEELHHFIKTSPIKPEPEVEELDFTWDFKSLFENIKDGKMSQHSFQHAFSIKKEGGIARFRYKRYPQTDVYIPVSGFKLLKDNVKFPAIGAANFNVEKLNLNGIEADYDKYLGTLKDENVKKKCKTSFCKLKRKIVQLPSIQKQLPKMKIQLLPKQKDCDVFEFVDDEEFIEIQGVQLQPEKLGSLKVGDDVVIYTNDLVTRPWIGRVIDLCNDLDFKIHWFKQKSKTIFLPHLNRDQSPYISIVNRNTIMFINLGGLANDKIIKLTPTMLKRISCEYDKKDSE